MFSIVTLPALEKQPRDYSPLHHSCLNTMKGVIQIKGVILSDKDVSSHQDNAASFTNGSLTTFIRPLVYLFNDSKAFAPASATDWSCFPSPPLTPIAPTTRPSRFSGTPPAKIITFPPFET